MIGTIIGIAGFAVGLIALWRSQASGIIAVQSHDVPMIGGGEAVFPDEVEVRYRGTSVPRLTSSNVWTWNAGQKAVPSSDLTADRRFRAVPCADGRSNRHMGRAGLSH